MYSHSYSCSLLPVFWNQSRRNVLVQVVRANALLEQLLFQFFHFRLIYRHVHFSGFYWPIFLDFVMLYCKIQGSTIYIYILHTNKYGQKIHICAFSVTRLFPVLGSQKSWPYTHFFYNLWWKNQMFFFVFRSIFYCNVTTIYAIGKHFFLP